MRRRRQPATAALLPEAVELLLGQATLQIGARVVARRGMPLEVHQAATVVLTGCVPAVVEADLVPPRERLLARDVAAELRELLVGAHDHRDRVPAHDRAQPALERRIAR